MKYITPIIMNMILLNGRTSSGRAQSVMEPDRVGVDVNVNTVKKIAASAMALVLDRYPHALNGRFLSPGFKLKPICDSRSPDIMSNTNISTRYAERVRSWK